MLRIAKSEARRNFAEVITRASQDGERVKVTHYGKTLAVILPKQDLTKLEDCEARTRAESKAETAAGRRARKVRGGAGGARRGGTG